MKWQFCFFSDTLRRFWKILKVMESSYFQKKKKKKKEGGGGGGGGA